MASVTETGYRESSVNQRRQRERRARRTQILKAARALILEKGLAGTSMGGIAKRSELGVGTLYFYFRDKQSLLAALQVEGLQRLHEKIRQARQTADSAVQAVRSAADLFYRFHIDEREYFAVFSAFLAAAETVFEAPYKQQVDQAVQGILQTFESIIESGVEGREFRAVRVRPFAVLLWGTLYGIIQFHKLETTALQGLDHRAYYHFAVEQWLDNLQGP